MTIRFGDPGLGVSGVSAGGAGEIGFTWEHPVAWTQLRKYFQQSMGEEEAKKLVSILESNAKSLEDFLDTAYLKANGGTVYGQTNFTGDVNIGGNINVPPTGSIMQYAGGNPASVPTGWLLANGQEIAIADYSNLYDILTNTGTVFPYGANTNGSGGAGSTHFRLPNMKGRVPVGIDNSQLEFDSMGETGGAKTHTLTTAQIPAHSHTVDDAGQHQHTVSITGSGTTNTSHTHTGTSTFARGISGGSLLGYTFNTSLEPNHSHGLQNTGGDGAHNNLQPYIVVNYIIKS